ncbi:MAG: DUF4959 domain-containing protein [Bacteroidales bacterium]|jgi:hypothetical protein|nr:DUF4959 domain-containing protein [Bacteroidales bacterium]
MKTLSKWSILALILVLTSCEDNERGQYPIHGGQPSPVEKILEVQPFGGGVNIYYTLPDERDLLYLVARYTLDTGEKIMSKVSKFENHIKIEGFRDAEPRLVELRTVDRSQNESEPVNIWVTPERSPILDIMETIVITEDFGGIKLEWENKDMVSILALVSIPQTKTTIENDLANDIQMRQVGQWSSNASKGKYNVRGFANEPAVFGVQICDRWGNFTELKKGEYTPRFEEAIPKPYKRWNGDTNIPYSRYSGSYEIEKAWDADLSNMFHTADPTVTGTLIAPMAFTFDMGMKCELSRFKIWHRSGDSWAFSHNNPKKLVVYGSNHSSPRKIYDNSLDPAHQEQKWVLLGSFDTVKPSGMPLNSTSAEDRQLAQVDGIDYVFDIGTDPYRYYRIDVLETWGLTPAIHFAEMSFWGAEYVENGGE